MCFFHKVTYDNSKKHCESGFLYHSNEHGSSSDVKYYEEVHALALQMPTFLKQGCFRERAIALAPIDVSLIPENTMPRLKLALAMLAQGFVWGNGVKNSNYLPKSIAIPLVNVAKHLDEPPILNYADYVLRNTASISPEINNIEKLAEYNNLYNAWRIYMPSEDRVFLSKFDGFGEKLRLLVIENAGFVESYNMILSALINFRKNHLTTITKYIEGKSGYSSNGVGTGGTFYAEYLGGLVDKIEELKVATT